MMEARDVLSFAKLSGVRNYRDWSFNIGMLLRSKGLYHFVCEPEPVPPTDLSALEYYEEKKQKALSLIYLALDDNIKLTVRNEDTALKCWKCLKHAYEPVSKARQATVYNEFHDIRYQPGEDMNVYLARILDKAKEVEDAGRKLEDIHIAFKMVWKLPKVYDSLVQQLYRLDDKYFTTIKVKEALLVEHDRLRCQGDIESDAMSSGAYASSKGGSQMEKGKVKAPITCYRCGLVGHIAKHCRKKKVVSNAAPTKKERRALYACANLTDRQSCEWILDSAATHHFCNNREWFSDFKEMSGVDAEMGEGSTEIKGQGNVKLICSVKGQQEEVTLLDVNYTPNMKRNLISEWLVLKHGYSTVGKFPNIEILHPDGTLFLIATAEGRLFKIHARPVGLDKKEPVKQRNFAASSTEGRSINAISASQKHSVGLWHSRYGHQSAQKLMQMKNANSVWGLDKMTGRLENCRVCAVAKTTRRSFPAIPKIVTKQPLELIHMDVCGPMPVASLGGSKYFLSIIDDYSRRVEVYFLTSKDQVFERFKQFMTTAERQKETKIKRIRTDNGLEFCSRKFEQYLQGLGVKMERTNTYSPEMNGVAERFNRTAMEGVRSMLEESGLPQTFWAEALGTFTHLQNRCLHSKLGDKTPFEMWFGYRPSVRHLRLFGCRVFLHIPKNKRSKLDRRALSGIMVGYAGKTKGYRVWVPSQKEVIESGHVRFDETTAGFSGDSLVKLDWEDRSERKSPHSKQESDHSSEESQKTSEESDSDEESSTSEDEMYRDGGAYQPSRTLLKPPGERESQKRGAGQSSTMVTPHPSIPGLFREANIRKRGVHAGKYDVEYLFQGSKAKDKIRSTKEAKAMCETRGFGYNPADWNFSTKPDRQPKEAQVTRSRPELHFTEVVVPETYEEATQGPDHALWDRAMVEEMATLKERKVWTLVNPKPGEKVLGSKWVYAVKRDSEGVIQRYKARLVALGFSQVEGLDYYETYSPVVNFVLVRLFFALLVGMLGWIHHQYDVTSAYLYGTLTEKILMRQPKGKVIQGKENMVCLLDKSLYGLHQSGREWFEELDRQFTSMGFTSLPCTNCVYRLGWTVFILVYVDDFAVFAKNVKCLEEAIRRISAKFALKDLGPIRQLLGVEFSEGEDGIVMHQKAYIDKLRRKFAGLCGPGKAVPLSPGADLEVRRPEEEIVSSEAFPYRSLIGSILFLATRTRPDIMLAVTTLSQYNCAPTARHCMLARDLFEYVMATQDKVLTLSGLSSCVLNMYTDASLATLDKAKSMSGFLVFLGSVLISWVSRKQTCTATSTMHAEYIALYDGVRELSWIQNVLKDCSGLNCDFQTPNVYCDSDSARHYAKNRVENSRNRHINIKYHFVREYWLNPGMNLYRVSTKENVSDIMTKALPRDRFEYLRRQIFVN